MPGEQDVRKAVNRVRDSLGRYLTYGAVRYRIREMPHAQTVSCPCCGYLTLSDEGYDVCTLCSWCDDGQDDPAADEVWGGPNGALSLTEGRTRFRDALTTRGSQDELFAIERDLEDEKRLLISVFDRMAAARTPADFLSGFRQAYERIPQLSRRRVERYHARRRETPAAGD